MRDILESDRCKKREIIAVSTGSGQSSQAAKSRIFFILEEIVKNILIVGTLFANWINNPCHHGSSFEMQVHACYSEQIICFKLLLRIFFMHLLFA